MSRYYFDIEGDNLLDQITKVHCIVLEEVETGEVLRFNSQPGGRPIMEALALMEEAEELIGHNIVDFDIRAIRKLYPWWRPKGRITDTLCLARLIWPDRFGLIAKDTKNRLPPQLSGLHSLKAWGYRLREYKGDFHENADWSCWTQEMEDYCVQDVVVTRRLHQLCMAKETDPEAIELEHAFLYIISDQEHHGVRFNVAKAQSLYSTLIAERLRLEARLQSIFPPRIETLKTPEFYFFESDFGQRFEAPTKGELTQQLREAGIPPRDFRGRIEPGPLRTREIPFNPGSTDQIAKRLIDKYGWEPVKFTEGGKPQVDESVLSGLPYEEVPALLEYLKVKKIIGQVAEGDSAWLKLEKAGRIHGSVNTNGAVTGRCTHSSPNMAQTPAVQVGKDGILHGLPGGYGWECRELFEPDPGHVLVGWDASGLELRCLAHFMALHDGGTYAKILLEGDIHSENQRAAGLPTRADAKTFIYAFLYGAGDAKIGSIVGGDSRKGKKLKEKFLNGLPALKRLRDGVLAAVKKRGYLIGLDGRILPIRSSHAALNTLLQSAGALVMKCHLVILKGWLDERGLVWGKDYAFVLNVHDEVQCTCRPELAETIGTLGVKAIVAAGEHFNFRCPLSGEYKIGKSWAETH